jgi:glyoxylase-like metal-dependent hydrolase (beta-lactamase superfamily II)
MQRTLTQNVNGHAVLALEAAPWIRIVPVRTPTLPPATHTNVYLVGEARLVAIDPASPWPDEQAALDAVVDGLAAAGARVDLVFLTHHHVDHVSGARHLAERLGVGVAAHPRTAERVAGRVDVTRLVDDGERLDYGPAGLRALLTPGHAPGHLCLVDEAAQALIAGDMVASVGTIIVEPDDGGDMAEYLASLERLRALGARALLPAHGPPLVDDAVDAKLAFYVQHRLEREARVLGALDAEARSVDALVPPAYPDVPAALYPLAARSLLAHLIKLEREGRARRVGSGWARV